MFHVEHREHKKSRAVCFLFHVKHFERKTKGIVSRETIPSSIFVITYYTSMFSANLAFSLMKSFLGITFSPIRSEKISFAAAASSSVTLRILRFYGCIVVSNNSSGIISPRPLYLWITTPLSFFHPFSFKIFASSASSYA